MEDNWSRQVDEIEALSSIFGDQLTVDKQNEKKFNVFISEGEGAHNYSLLLQVTFGPDYPSDAPPTYGIKDSNLNKDEVSRLACLLDQIYLDNMGESIVYQWVDKVRETLQNSSKLSETAEECISQKELVQTQDDVDDPESCSSEDEPHISYEPTKPELKSDIQLPPIHHGEFVKDRKSIFQGHLAPVTDKRQVDMVMDKLKESKKIATATHNIIAYRIDCNNGGFITGCFDDGETHAGSRMLHLLDIVDARNVLVVVTRWYGGIHLGPDRFKHINNCTREMLLMHGYISEKSTSKQTPKSHVDDLSQSKGCLSLIKCRN